VLTALLDQLPLVSARDVVDAGSEDLVGLLARELPLTWRDKPRTQRAYRAIALAYLTAGSNVCSGMVAVRIEDQLRSWLAGAEPDDLQRVGQSLSKVDPDVGREWTAFAMAQRARNGRFSKAKPATDAAKSGRFGFRLPGRRGREE
jgi:hypothetical protein